MYFFKKDNFFLNMRSRKRGKYKTIAIKKHNISIYNGLYYKY